MNYNLGNLPSTVNGILRFPFDSGVDPEAGIGSGSASADEDPDAVVGGSASEIEFSIDAMRNYEK